MCKYLPINFDNLQTISSYNIYINNKSRRSRFRTSPSVKKCKNMTRKWHYSIIKCTIDLCSSMILLRATRSRKEKHLEHSKRSDVIILDPVNYRPRVLTISKRGVVMYQLNLKNHSGRVPLILWMSAASLFAPYIQDTAITSKKAM